MARYRKCAHLLLLVLLVCGVALSQVSGGAPFVEVVASRVNIRKGPGTETEIVAQSRKGDIFHLAGEEGDWYVIIMFSGEPRYLFKSLARTTTRVPPPPQEDGLLRHVMRALFEAEDRALGEASQMRVVDIDRNLEYDRLLNDRYKLEVFHRFGLSPANYDQIRVEGRRTKGE